MTQLPGAARGTRPSSDESALVRSTLEKLLAAPAPVRRFAPRSAAPPQAACPQVVPEPAPTVVPPSPERTESPAPPSGPTSLEIDESIHRAVEAVRVEFDLRLREEAGLARGTVETISRETVRQALAPVEARLTQLQRRVTLALRIGIAAGLVAAFALQGLF